MILEMLAMLAAATSAPDEKTATAVIAADDAWLAAEIRGDADYLDQLLMPDYRTVAPDGKATTKAVLVSHARERTPDGTLAKRVADWKAAHPTEPSVAITGETAVLTWVSIDPKSAGLISSCDIFVYDAGHWRALYSQHSAASA